MPLWSPLGGDRALAETPFVLCLLEKGSPRCVLKHLTDTLVGLGRALEVLVALDLLLDELALLQSGLAY